MIVGAKGSAYEGFAFEFLLELPDDYPMSGPRISMLTKIFHPFLSDTGPCCCFYDRWTPAFQIKTMLIESKFQ